MTKIEWTDETWNPITGCTKISAGCKHCYAERMAKRLAGRCGYPAAPHEFDVTLHPDRLEQPLHWKKPRRVFVCSMSDLFHADVPFEYVNRIFEVMEQSPQHTFQVLTKRHRRMLEYLRWWQQVEGCEFDVPNIWLGVTVENQARFNERVLCLLLTNAAVRFVSIEPMLGPINTVLQFDGKDVDTLRGYWAKQHAPPYGPPYCGAFEGIDWVICGGESGPGARPMKPDWVRDLRDQCVNAGVPFFFKQWGGVHKKKAGRLLDGREWNQFPGAAQ